MVFQCVFYAFHTQAECGVYVLRTPIRRLDVVFMYYIPPYAGWMWCLCITYPHTQAGWQACGVWKCGGWYGRGEEG